ncbi:MAG: hypothetical protein ACE5PV_06605 [Candidatus Poribacteria bacterium]
MHRKSLLTLTIVFCVILGYAFSAVAVELAFEAEGANTIEAPMVVAVPADAAAQGGPEPDAPSGDKFVWVPGPPTTGGGGEGFMEFVVNIPANGTYAIWGRVIAWDGNSDSFWVTITPTDENPQETNNTTYRWAVAQGNAWHWDRINQWLDGGTFDREWDLPKGEATIKIWTREDATMLDCIYITDNLSADEAEVNPKLPSELPPPQPGTAVELHGKLATTWGSMKATR